MGVVSDLLARFQADGLDASWEGMGGDTRAIVIRFGAHATIIVGDRDSPFGEGAYNSDESVWGFFARAYRMEGDTEATDDDSEGWLYCTPDDAGMAAKFADPGEEDEIVDLAYESDEVYAAVSEAVSDGKVGRIRLDSDALHFQCACCDADMSVGVAVWNDFRIREVDHVGCAHRGGIDLVYQRAHA